MLSKIGSVHSNAASLQCDVLFLLYLATCCLFNKKLSKCGTNTQYTYYNITSLSQFSYLFKCYLSICGFHRSVSFTAARTGVAGH